MTSDLSRRSFARLFALFAARAAFPGAWVGKVLAEAKAVPDEGLLRIRLSDFPTLQNDFGSVRIGTSGIDADHQPLGLFYPVVINRAPNNLFYALDSACTHEGCVVPTFDQGLGYIECPCHGSRYGLDGLVLNGPANFPLRQFAVRFDGGDNLAIELPDISFALEAVDVATGSGRLQLTFIAFDQIEYELRFRPNVEAEWSGPVSFALTKSGPADQTVVVGQADYASVFLNPTSPSGFYAVAMRIRAV